MIHIEKFSTENQTLSRTAFEIRSKVFVEEQKVDSREEFDQFEDICLHYLLYYKDSPAGTARWRETEKGIKLERFAVLKEFRGKGLGEMLVRTVLSDVLPKKMKLYLHAQLTAVPLYEKCGFKKQGEIFSECDIDHYLMSYKL